MKLGSKGFVSFIREQGIVGLSVGFVLGSAVTGLAKSLVNDIVSPLLGIFLGGVDSLESAVLNISGAQVKWGAFVTTLIDFLVIALVIYFFVRVLRLEKVDKKKPKKK